MSTLICPFRLCISITVFIVPIVYFYNITQVVTKDDSP